MNFTKNNLARFVSSFLFSLLILACFLASLNLQVKSFDGNVTDTISIRQTKKDNNLVLDYHILQTFSSPSRGIFLSLPKNQDGIWTNYQINQVRRSQKLPDSGIDFQQSLLATKQNQKYELIKEWNQLRLRVGEMDKFLENGSYLYHIQLQFPVSNYQQNLTLLQEWTDHVTNLEVRADNQVYCNKDQLKASCTPQKVQILVNPSSSKVSIFQKTLLDIWLYLGVILVVLILIYILWYILAKDPNYGYPIDKPEFEPPAILPWQAQFLLSDGDLDFNNTFLSYLLYLSHRQFIKISPQTPKLVEINGEEKIDKINIQILQPLPEFLPQQFNDCIQKVAKLGFNQGIYDSQISSTLDVSEYIKNDMKKYHSQMRFFSGILLLIGFLLFVGAFLLQVLLNILQILILLGNSYFAIITTGYVLFSIGFLFVLSKFSKLNPEGAFLKAYCQRYKFYIQKAEQYKLDFSNNPDSGVQYYLIALPFAAAFGYLDQFEKYLQKILPASQDLESASELSAGLAVASFYVPPSTSSSDSGGDFSSSSGGFDGGGGSW